MEMAQKIASETGGAGEDEAAGDRPLARPAVRASMEDELIFQTFVNRSDDMAGCAARAEGREICANAAAGRSPADHGGPLMTEPIGLPARPLSATRHFDPAPSTAPRCSSPAPAPASGKAIASEFARLERM